MPEFQAPGVYVEEVAFRAKTIEPVGTTLTGFVGPCRSGPVAGMPPLLTSLAAFERRYGDGVPLRFGAQTVNNDLWHAVRAFFQKGGQALHVSRVYRAGPADDGCARLSLGGDGGVQLQARHPGAAGNVALHVSFRLGANLLQAQAAPDGRLQPVLAPQADGALVWLRTARVPQPPGPDNAFFARCDHGTMTADDLARGRLVAEVGVALLKPAEFLVFRVAQQAAA